MTFPTLYQRTRTGAIQTWEIEAVAGYGDDSEQYGEIVTRHGQLGGAIQVGRDVVHKGKNAGKANATTPLEQAEKEAAAKWTKKRDREGYVEDLARAQAGESDRGGTPPMLATVLADIAPEHLQYPADWQIKFNGNRVEAEVVDGVCTLWSRKQKEIVSMPHIKAAYERAFAGIRGRFVLDGEGYRHGLSLQRISGFFRTKVPKDGYLEFGHFVYDIKSHGGPWEERREVLRALFRDIIYPRLGAGSHPILEVQTHRIASLEEGQVLARAAVQNGYEGGIMRQLRTPYEADVRSVGLAKLKDYKEAEFRIVGVHEGRGKFAGKAIFELVTDGGVAFDCCAPGDMEEKAMYLKDPPKAIGKHLTVRYFEMSEDHTPLQGTPVAVRDYE